jgi:hypothetical protein
MRENILLYALIELRINELFKSTTGKKNVKQILVICIQHLTNATNAAGRI